MDIIQQVSPFHDLHYYVEFVILSNWVIFSLEVIVFHNVRVNQVSSVAEFLVRAQHRHLDTLLVFLEGRHFLVFIYGQTDSRYVYFENFCLTAFPYTLPISLVDLKVLNWTIISPKNLNIDL